jgi:hypothetical protein
MTQYTEPTKIIARRSVLKAAIETLTSNRDNATLARRSYVREVRDHELKSDNKYDKQNAAQLSDEIIEKWEAFYDSVTQSKNASNLKVAYLSGPNPENDLRVFCDAGILPENIWAFESENTLYSQAVVSALNSEFPFIKLINGGIDGFLEASPQRFDIIYLDFCGPLPSRNKKQKTLGAITKILAQHALNSPGVLITNVSLPTVEQDEHGRELLAKLVACYLYPKEFLEDYESDSGFTEGAIAQGFEFDAWMNSVRSDLDNYYGQFVTRLIMDHASFISPYDRFPRKSGLFRKFFNDKDKVKLNDHVNSIFHFDRDYDGGDIIVDAGIWPIPWTLAALDKKLNAKDANYPQWIYVDDEFAQFAERFVSQLNTKGDKKELIDGVSTMSYLMSEGNGQEHFLSKSLANIANNHSFRHYYQFCDLVLFHQIIELLFRQVAVPYHVNVQQTKRWKYIAKSTPMYLDMTVLDECRYLYDWMPTADMLSAGMFDIERQLSYRFALDGVAKHRRWYNPEYFSGTAVVDQFTEPFQAKVLAQRKTLNT